MLSRATHPEKVNLFTFICRGNYSNNPKCMSVRIFLEKIILKLAFSCNGDNSIINITRMDTFARPFLMTYNSVLKHISFLWVVLLLCIQNVVSIKEDIC